MEAAEPGSTILVGPGVLEGLGCKRHVKGVTVIGTPETVIRAPLSWNGTDGLVLRGLRFEGEFAGMSFMSDPDQPIGKVAIEDCEWYRVPKPIVCHATPGGERPRYFAVRRANMMSCFRDVNTAGIAVSADGWLVEDSVFYSSGGGNQCHGIYSFFQSGPGTVRRCLGSQLNVENFADLRGGGTFAECVTHQVCGGAVSSSGNVVVIDNVDIEGGGVPGGDSSIAFSLTGSQGSAATVFRNIVTLPVRRSTGLVVQGDHSIARVTENCFDDAGGPEGRAIKCNDSFDGRLELTHNRIRQASGPAMILDRSIKTHVVANVFDATHGEVVRTVMPLADFSRFLGGGNILDQRLSPLDIRPATWGGTLMRDWSGYLAWAMGVAAR
ncbi:MAG: hypothetical protein ACKVW3_11735 [Phycisphaerales bacterium]